MADTNDDSTQTTTLFGGSSATTSIPTTSLFGSTTATTASSTTENNGLAPDEDCSKEYEPVVRLAEVETKTGEEEEEVLFKIRSKLFRFAKDRGEWKERGTGDVRILRHRSNDKIRLLMRREKTLKICLNHYVSPAVTLRENVGSDRSWVWQAIDYADGEADPSLLAIRFRDSDCAQQFREHYDKARDHMAKLAGSTADKEEEEEGDGDEEKKEEDEEKEKETEDDSKKEENDDKEEEPKKESA